MPLKPIMENQGPFTPIVPVERQLTYGRLLLTYMAPLLNPMRPDPEDVEPYNDYWLDVLMEREAEEDIVDELH